MPTSHETDFYSAPARSTTDVLIDIDVDNDLSSAADLGGDTLTGLLLPSDYTTAAMTFEVSADGVTYYALYNQDGAVTVAASEAVADRAISLNPADWYGWRYVKIATGSAQTSTDKTITLISRAL